MEREKDIKMIEQDSSSLLKRNSAFGGGAFAPNTIMASLTIKELALLEGKLPPKILGLVVEWGSLHQEELIEDWHLAKKFAKLRKIPPLE